MSHSYGTPTALWPLANTLPNLPELVTVAPHDVFAPQGFDNNDSAQVTIAGDMLNTCFKAGPATAEVDQVRKTILIRNRAYFYSSCWCLYVLVPYVKTIDLGVLPVGTYKILFEQENGKLQRKGIMPVALSANSGPDDYLYALIDEATVEPKEEGSPRTLKLSGFLTSSCMELSAVKVLYRAPNVIEVLPIVSIENEAGCDARKRPFVKEVSLNPPWTGLTLVHVRSLNGQALNKVTQF
jgi:hypothetical protein